MCIGSSDNVPSTTGSGGCVDGNSCQVLLLVQKGSGNEYRFKLASHGRPESKSVTVKATVTLENRDFLTKGFPDNLMYMEGRMKSVTDLENIVWIKYSQLPTPACINSRNQCSRDEDWQKVLIPEEVSTVDGMVVFPFRTDDEKVFFKTPPSYGALDGSGTPSTLNVHLSTDKVVLSLHQITSSWGESDDGSKFPKDDAKLVNLIETKPFLLFSSKAPTFLDAKRSDPNDLTWLWILLALIVIVVLLCLLFWYIRKRRETTADGHVAVSDSDYYSRSSAGSALSNPSRNMNADMGPSARSSMGSSKPSFGASAIPSATPSAKALSSSSSHTPHRSHPHPSMSYSPKLSSTLKESTGQLPASTGKLSSVKTSIPTSTGPSSPHSSHRTMIASSSTAAAAGGKSGFPALFSKSANASSSSPSASHKNPKVMAGLSSV